MSAKKRTAQAVDVLEPATAPKARTGASAGKSQVVEEPPFKWGMIYLLARIFYAMRQRTEDALKPHNLTPMQFTIMATLGRRQGLSSAELSRRFSVTPQTMGEMIGNLERRSLVARAQDPTNRRALKLNLTQEGERLLRACETAMHDVEAAMFEDMSPREFEALRARMINLHAHLGLTFTVG
jgi:DNA-binding MarR family transcriptional regulator